MDAAAKALHTPLYLFFVGSTHTRKEQSPLTRGFKKALVNFAEITKAFLNTRVKGHCSLRVRVEPAKKFYVTTWWKLN